VTHFNIFIGFSSSDSCLASLACGDRNATQRLLVTDTQAFRNPVVGDD
jgi:hypothetical protein